MKQISKLIDKVTDSIGRYAAWLCIVMVVVMATVVALRYVFQFGSIALQESLMYINALIFTLGAAYTLKAQGHVRVDVFYSRMDERQKALVDFLGGVLFLLPSAIFIMWICWDYVAVAWRIKESSPETSGLPLVYLLKATMLLLFFLLLVQGISELAKSIAKIRQGSA